MNAYPHIPNGLTSFAKVEQVSSPFTPYIRREVVPYDFKESRLPVYSGTSDPVSHVQAFESIVSLKALSDGIKCRLFLISYGAQVLDWFYHLPPQSITCFNDLQREFLSRFGTFRKRKKDVGALFQIKQGDDESYAHFIDRFQKETLDIVNVDQDFYKVAFISGLRQGPLKFKVTTKMPDTYGDLIDCANRFVGAEAMNSGYISHLNQMAQAPEKFSPHQLDDGPLHNYLPLNHNSNLLQYDQDPNLPRLADNSKFLSSTCTLLFYHICCLLFFCRDYPILRLADISKFSSEDNMCLQASFRYLRVIILRCFPIIFVLQSSLEDIHILFILQSNSGRAVAARSAGATDCFLSPLLQAARPLARCSARGGDLLLFGKRWRTQSSVRLREADSLLPPALQPAHPDGNQPSCPPAVGGLDFSPPGRQPSSPSKGCHQSTAALTNRRDLDSSVRQVGSLCRQAMATSLQQEAACPTRPPQVGRTRYAVR
ncbi:hypothetical protein KSP39_PZI015852 [Platanthera zijinensis]|uniref:Retrotransposon gag domain-containing protein n=1 Tax=Platanthera zijinensis TaxID=2320716 RepID=A0AAP0G1R3_9ASPA